MPPIADDSDPPTADDADSDSASGTFPGEDPRTDALGDSDASDDASNETDAPSDSDDSELGPDSSGPDSSGPDSSGPDSSDPDSSNDESETDPSDDSGCPHDGNVTYRFNGAESWPADVLERLTSAMDEAMAYYNCYSDLEKELTINYRDGVPTAEGNVDGVISFGSDRGYMVTATAMHEVGHTMGVAYYPWTELIADSRWTGEAVKQVMENLPAEERDPDMYSQRTYITCDGQHFWPYGLNQASEHQSEWSLINHVRIVAAMNEDKVNYIATH